MSSDAAAGVARVAPAVAPAGDAPTDPAAANAQIEGSRDSDSDFDDSLPRRKKPGEHDREIAGATTNLKTAVQLPYADDELPPPLPEEAPPKDEPKDDGWEPLIDPTTKLYYFRNKFTGKTQWENPRVPEATATPASYDRYGVVATTSSGAPGTSSPPKRKYGGYNPAIHGNYDPNADYALEAQREEEEAEAAAASAAAIAAGLPDPNATDYSTTAAFNRFTGRFQAPGNNAEYHNDENKSKRQMNNFFDVDAAANSHDGRSLKAERRGKTLTKAELKAFKEKRHKKKEEKRRAWLRD